jgi:hypothetical protein
MHTTPLTALGWAEGRAGCALRCGMGHADERHSGGCELGSFSPFLSDDRELVITNVVS